MAAPKVIELWVHFLTQKPAAPNSSRDPSYGSAKSSLKIVVNFGRRSRAVPLYVEQGSLLYRTGQQFSKSSLGRLETDQLSRVGIGSSFRATATLDPVWEYSLRIGKSSVDEGASAPEPLLLRFNLGQFATQVVSCSDCRRTVTWLILPVVICLSQRLSHACLSTSLTKVKPRMAH